MDDPMANELMATLNRALRDRRYSASRASTEAGSPDLVRNIRRGRMPSLERLNALCEVLDLDFYVGPRRHAGAIDVRRLREAIASTERTLGAHGIALQLEARADAIAAVYDLLDRAGAGDGGAGSRTHRGARAGAGRRALSTGGWTPSPAPHPPLHRRGVLSETGVERERQRRRRGSKLDPYMRFITETLG